jgi:hypothetical protein
LLHWAFRSFDLDRVHRGDNDLIPRLALDLFRRPRLERERVGAGRQSVQGKDAPAIRDITLVRHLFHDHVDSGNAGRFLAAVNI